MGYEEVINPRLAIWVASYDLYSKSPLVWKAEGYAIDGYHGFGNSKTRYFTGMLSLISVKKQKLTQYLSVSSVHFSHEGFKWLIKSAEKLPQTPFLISSDLGLEIIFDGYVIMNKEQDLINLSEPEDWVYSVSSESWFGVMKVKENERVHLIAFSSNNSARVSRKDQLWSFEWDCSAGVIEDMEKQRLHLVGEAK